MSFTQSSPTCGRIPLPALSLRPGRQPYRPRLLYCRRQERRWTIVCGSPSRNPPTGYRRDSPISSSLFSHGPPLCAVGSELANRDSPLQIQRERLGHHQSHFDGGWHVCQAVFPEPQSAAACRRVERRDSAHEALPRLQSASSWSVMEQLVSGVCRLSWAFHATCNSPPDVRRGDTGQ